MAKIPLSAILKYGVSRLKEPSTYAGIASVAIGVSQVATHAKQAADAWKGEGPMAGIIAIAAGIIAVTAKDEKKPAEPEVMDADFTVVDPAKAGENDTPK